MQIQWLGQSCFKISIRSSDGDITVITDPVGEKYGIKIGKHNADIVTVSHQHEDHNNIDAIKNDAFIIENPGEYETKGVFVYGIAAYHDASQGSERGLNTIYAIKAEDMRVVHLGDLGHQLSNEQIEQIGDVDVLLVPVGGQYTLDAKGATELISQLDPRLVIPMHYSIPGLTMSKEIAGVDQFLKACALPAETLPRLKISKKDLPQDSTKVIVLEQS